MRRAAMEATSTKKNTVINNNVLIIAMVSLVLSIVVVLIPWALQFSGSPISTNPSNWGVFGDYFGGVLSTIISALGFIGIILTINIQARAISAQLSGITQEKEIRDDEVYSKQAIECLDEALATLTDPENGRLLRSRVAWLESARLILTAQALSRDIKSASMRRVYGAAEKLARSKFSSKLDPRYCRETMQPSYYDGPDWVAYFSDNKQEKLERYSVYVIYKFTSWQSDELDILVSAREEIDINAISQEYFGVRSFLEKERNSI